MLELIDDLKDIKLAIFDLDGVVYRGNNIIPGVGDIIRSLKELSIKVVFNSNNSTLTRVMYVEKLRKFNIYCTVEEIYTSASILAEEITKLKSNAHIYVIGETGLKEELKAKGHQISNIENSYKNIDYVIVGLDRQFDYAKLAFAQQCISQGHALFYATNTDATLPDQDRELPGAGCMVAALQTCTSQKPVHIFGKPSPIGINRILDQTNTEKDKAVIFGDRLNTDILAGNRAQIKTVLVLTGVTTKEQIEELQTTTPIDLELIPDITINSLNEIVTQKD
jgi:4-nitrophenyl phosphatase